MKLYHSMDCARDTSGQVTVQTKTRNDIPGRIEIQIPMSMPRCFFPEIKGTGFTVIHPHDRKSTTTYISCLWIGDGKCKLNCDRCIYCVSSFLQDLKTYLAGIGSGTDDHVFRSEERRVGKECGSR